MFFFGHGIWIFWHVFCTYPLLPLDYKAFAYPVSELSRAYIAMASYRCGQTVYAMHRATDVACVVQQGHWKLILPRVCLQIAIGLQENCLYNRNASYVYICSRCSCSPWIFLASYFNAFAADSSKLSWWDSQSF